MVAHYSKILHDSSLGWAMSGNVHWLWPVFATLHLFGMALVVAWIGAIDLRLLGVAKGLPVRALQALAPIGWLGFAITLVTGVGFYAGTPEQYQNVAFGAKIISIILAGANGVLFYASGMARAVSEVAAGEDAPPTAKLSAAASLILWIGVIFWGRMIPIFSSGF
jgi:hypothetical protein